VSVNESNGTGRLLSLDALRGFDMLFLMGGEGLVCAIAALCGDPNYIEKFGHAQWDGLQFMDTIFPLFLFMAGVSFPFSCAKSREKGMSDGTIALRCLKRFAILAFLGIMGGFLRFDFPTMRVWSVLGRIGLAWACAAWLYLLFRTRMRLIVAVLLLAITLVGTLLLIAPDAQTIAYPASLKGLEAFGRGPFSPAGNFGCWLDRTLTRGHMYREMFDPEGFAGMLPSVVTALLGGFAGEIVRRAGGPTGRKALELLACGVVCLAFGAALATVCPINKALWSPSFTLVVGGYSFAMFALFYYLIDVRQWRRGVFFFTVIGMNSITIFLGRRIFSLDRVRDYFFAGLASLCPAGWNSLVLSLGYIAVCWLFLYFLYRKNVFLKV